jgi:prepilin-type N-terminal cleavage/methylation domain-containing protein
MNQKAFTLVEIIVTAIIVGLLGMMALPNFMKTMNRSYAQDALHSLVAIYSGEQNYSQNHGDNYCYSSTTPACDSLSHINTALDLNIASSGDMTYSCDNVTKTCSAVAAAGSKAGGATGFTMKVSLDPAYSINVTDNPVYCDASGMPNSVGVGHNPCCTAGGGAANANCP